VVVIRTEGQNECKEVDKTKKDEKKKTRFDKMWFIHIIWLILILFEIFTEYTFIYVYCIFIVFNGSIFTVKLIVTDLLFYFMIIVWGRRFLRWIFAEWKLSKKEQEKKEENS